MLRHLWLGAALALVGFGSASVAQINQTEPGPLIAPSGAIETSSPVFEWRPFGETRRYRIEVLDDAGEPIAAITKDAGDFNCDTGVCRFQFRYFYSGSYVWRVRPHDGEEAGEPAGSMAFTRLSQTRFSPRRELSLEPDAGALLCPHGPTGTGVCKASTAMSAAEKCRIQGHFNPVRATPFIARQSCPISDPETRMRPAIEIPLDGDRQVNVDSSVLPIDIDGDGIYELVQHYGQGLVRVYDLDGTKRWEVRGPGRSTQPWHADRLAVGDLDGDGGDEIVHCWRRGESATLVVRDGLTGNVTRETDLAGAVPERPCHAAMFPMEGRSAPLILVPQKNMSEDYQGNWLDQLSVIDAYDADLNLVWRTETPIAGHWFFPMDEDGNGRYEFVFAGRYKLDGDGRIDCVLPGWADPLGQDHIDSAVVADIDPLNPGLEIIAVGQTGIRLHDAEDCRILWELEGWEIIEDAQRVAVSDLEPASPGLEIVVQERASSPKRAMHSLSSDGDILMSFAGGQLDLRQAPINANVGFGTSGSTLLLDGSVIDAQGNELSDRSWYEARQVLSDDERQLRHFEQRHLTGFPFDLIGDCRNEFVAWGRDRIVIGTPQ